VASVSGKEMGSVVTVPFGDVTPGNECNIVREQLTAKTYRWRQRANLVFLIRNLGIGGAERQLVALASNLDREKFDITVLTLYGDGELLGELSRAGVRIVSLHKKGRWDLKSVTRHLLRVLRKLKPDILHSYLTAQNLLAVMAKAALPRTRIVWGVQASNLNDRKRDWLSLVNCRVETWLSRFPDLVIFNSVAGRNYHLAAGFARARTVVIPNGIDTQRFTPNRQAGLECRASWGIHQGSLAIGLVGRLDRVKDHGIFLRAAEIFSQSGTDAKFVCIGGGPDDYLRELRQLAAGLGLSDKVIWTGSLTDMPSAYNALDICCSSSFGEGLSNAIAEAMACEVPCVVTNVGDSALVVGDTGVVVPRRNPDALAAGWAAMADLMTQNPGLGEAARKRIESRFSMPALISNTSEALLALL
jgi:glycosyltransferase involved in cell wall biosynthesis